MTIKLWKPGGALTTRGAMASRDFQAWMRGLFLQLPERLMPTDTKMADYSAVAWDLVRVDFNKRSFAILFPTGPEDGTEIGYKEVSNGVGTVEIQAGTDDTVEGAGNINLTTGMEGLIFVYDATLRDWMKLG